MKNKEFDFGAFMKQAIEGMYAGKPLNGDMNFVKFNTYFSNSNLSLRNIQLLTYLTPTLIIAFMQANQ